MTTLATHTLRLTDRIDEIQERLEESGDRIDPDEFVGALTYVRDDGR